MKWVLNRMFREDLSEQVVSEKVHGGEEGMRCITPQERGLWEKGADRAKTQEQEQCGCAWENQTENRNQRDETQELWDQIGSQ